MYNNEKARYIIKLATADHKMAVAFYQSSLIIKSYNMAEDINKENEDEEVIPAPEGAKYLSDIPNFKFPVNCLFNKAKTGCGGTELVLRDDKNVIISVPYISLIKNKIEKNTEHGDRSNEILGVYGGVTEDEVKQYITSHAIKKIMVTYDSLPKLVKWIQTIDNNEDKVFKDYFLLVDEWHCLFNYYDFRGEAIRGLLNIAPKFNRVTYMTATPINDDFTPNKLKKLHRVRVNWEGKKKLQVTLLETNSPWEMLYAKIREINDKQPDINFHVFMNSVSMIIDFLNHIRLTKESVRIVCADKQENKDKLALLDEKYEIAHLSDPVKGINFYTATAFEGCDIFDPNGMNIIVSNTSIPHTILDIQSTFTQVCGRLRDSKHKNEVLYIFNVSDSKLPSEELITELKKEHETDRAFYEELNQLSEGNRERVLQLIKLSNNKKLPKYLIINNKTIFEIDTELYKLEIWKEHLQHDVFKSKEAVQDECERCNMEVIANNFQYMKLTYSEKLLERIKASKANISNKDLFEAYHSLREESRNTLINMNPREEYEKIESYKPIIKKYYDTLGIDEIRRLDYKIDKLDTAFIKKKNLPKNIQLVEIFSRGIQYGKEYRSPEITEKIKEICRTHELPRISNEELKTYFDCKEYQKKIEGKTTNIIKFIRRKTLNF